MNQNKINLKCNNKIKIKIKFKFKNLIKIIIYKN